jgi:uncharacterized protein (DUF433 family)
MPRRHDQWKLRRPINQLAGAEAGAARLSDFPYLTHQDILACLAYAAEREHRMLVANE